jgi:hypothetical protein
MGGVFNRLLSSVDLIGVASGNYIGAAAETAIGQAYSLLNTEMSVEERRALTRNTDHLKRYPNDSRNSTIVKEIEKLEKKKTAALVRKQLDHSKQAAQKGDIDKAMFYAEIASYLDGQSQIAQAELQKLSKSYLQRSEQQNQGLSVQAEKLASPEQQEDIEELLLALSLRDQQQVARQAASLEKKYGGKPLADSARDALSVALEMQGRHEEAQKMIERLADSAKPRVQSSRHLPGGAQRTPRRIGEVCPSGRRFAEEEPDLCRRRRRRSRSGRSCHSRCRQCHDG